jgi:hypothetical protein
MVCVDLLSFTVVSITATTGAFAIVLAFLYLLGLRFAVEEGKTIMRAIIVFWFAFGVQQFGFLYFNLRVISGEAEPGDVHFMFNLPLEIILCIATLFYLWATVRRNPPKLRLNGNGVAPPLKYH